MYHQVKWYYLKYFTVGFLLDIRFHIALIYLGIVVNYLVLCEQIFALLYFTGRITGTENEGQQQYENKLCIPWFY
jgi:hypothetical protein